MLKLHTLKVTKGSRSRRKVVGRGWVLVMVHIPVAETKGRRPARAAEQGQDLKEAVSL